MSSRGSGTPSVALPSRICVSIGESSPERLLGLAYTEASRGETLFEFCLESLSDPPDGPGAVRDFTRRWPHAWVIVTCRKGGGHFHGSTDQQLRLLSASVDAGARIIDLEIETASHTQQWMRQMGDRCLRIVSYHNYRSAPPLGPLLKTLESVPADILKVAVTSKDAQTPCKLIERARQYARPSIFLVMGSSGLPTRILGPCAGRSFTYASHPSAAATAIGQLDVQTLRQTYRLDELSPETEFIAGLSCPAYDLSHSVEYNKVLSRAGPQIVYVPWTCLRTIPSLLFSPSMRTCGMALHRDFDSRAFGFADRVDVEAKNAGIVDTLWKRHGKWCAGWKLGDSIAAILKTTLDRGANVAVIADTPRQRRAIERLISAHRYSVAVAAASHADCSVDVSRMVVNYSSKVEKIDLRGEVIRRQVEVWLGRQ